MHSSVILSRAKNLWILAVALGITASLGTFASSATEAVAECRPAWSEILTPPGSNSFYAVSTVAQDDVWAVGSHYDGVDDRPLAEHFDGSQ
jgi:hypothetical protein